MPLATISPAILEAMAASETGEAALFLLTIEHESLPAPLRFTMDPIDPGNPVPIVSRGDEYVPFPFEAILPAYPGEGPPRAQLVLSNIHRAIPAWLLGATGEVHVTIDVVPASDPDDVQTTSGRLLWLEAEGDVRNITVTLGALDGRRTAYPRRSITPDLFPAAFRVAT